MTLRVHESSYPGAGNGEVPCCVSALVLATAALRTAGTAATVAGEPLVVRELIEEASAAALAAQRRKVSVSETQRVG